MAIETNVAVERPKKRAMIGPVMQIGVERTVMPLTVKIVELLLIRYRKISDVILLLLSLFS
jgi:hypothetical protein